MADTATKALACRVPMTEYVQILKAAQAAKLTISDYLIQKLYQPDLTADLQRSQQQLQERTLQAQQYEERVRREATLNQHLKQTIKGLQREKEQHTQTALSSEQQLAQQSEEAQGQLMQLRTELANLTYLNRKAASQHQQDRQQLAKLEQELEAAKQQLTQQTAGYSEYRARMRQMKTEIQEIHQKNLLGVTVKEIWQKLDEYIREESTLDPLLERLLGKRL